MKRKLTNLSIPILLQLSNLKLIQFISCIKYQSFLLYKSYPSYYLEESVQCECFNITKICSGLVLVSQGPTVYDLNSTNKHVSEKAVFLYLGEHGTHNCNPYLRE